MKKRIAIVVMASIVGGVISLFAIALIMYIISNQPYWDIFSAPLLYAIWVIVVTVGVAVAAIDIRMRGSKRVLKVNVDLEDSHFMDDKEIRTNDGFTTTKLSELGMVKDGVPVIAKAGKSDIDIVLKNPIHTLVIGATGTGKTTAFVSPMIEILARTASKPSLVITDPKGELYVKHAATLEREGYTVNVIDLSDVYHSTQWNPFNDVWRKTDELKNGRVQQRSGKYYYADIEYLTEDLAERARYERNKRLNDEIFIDIQDLVYTMCPVENKHDSTWQRGARDLLFSLCLAFWEDVRDGYMRKEQFNLYNLYRNVTDYAKGECEELKAYIETREATSRARGLSNTVLVSEDRTLSSYLGDVNQYMNWLADGGIAALTSGNEIEFSEFDEKPNALFLKIPDEKENRHKLVALFVTQMYKALVDKARRNEELGRTVEAELLRNVYFLMDEFGNLPKMHNMSNIVTVGRSRHIFMIPVIQDYNQLDDKYGKEVAATIRSNCNIQIFIGSNDENTRRLISEQCGKKRVKQISYNETRDMSVSTQANSVPLIYPNDLEHLNDPANGIIGNNIVLSLGNYPIKGKISPVYQQERFYQTSRTEMKGRPFINFDEKSNHYDIAKVTIFLEQERQLNDMQEQNFAQEEVTGEQAEQAELVEQVGQVERAERQIESEKNILFRLKLLQDKIPDSELQTLVNIDNSKRIEMLDRIITVAGDTGQTFLIADLIAVKKVIEYYVSKEENQTGESDNGR